MVMSYIGFGFFFEITYILKSEAKPNSFSWSLAINVFGKRLNSSLLWSILYIWTAERKKHKR
jgi:hypothetical protein